MRDQLSDTRCGISGFSVQIVGIAVNDCPACLLQLAVLVILSAVHIRKPAVPELPLCIQRRISGQFKNCALIGIGGSAAICDSVPADEIVALTGKGVGIQGSVHTDFKALRLHTALAAVGIEGDGVELTGSCRVLCRISGILFSNHNLRAPAGEGVAVVLVRSLICAALEGRHGALQIIFLIYDLTINYPSDMCARRAAPDAADIVDGIAGACVRSFRVGAVGVAKPCGSNGDFRISNFSANKIYLLLFFNLICCCFRAECTLLNILTGSPGGADIRTACGGINAAFCGQLSVYIHLCIGKRRTGACRPAGCVDHRNILRFTGATVAAPLVHIIDIDALFVGHL